MTWVVKVGKNYLETVVWCLVTESQRDAYRFDTRAKAQRMVEALANDYQYRGVRVVRLVPRTSEAKK